MTARADDPQAATDTAAGGPELAEPAAMGERSPSGDRTRTALRGIGQTLITFGVVVALFVVYEAFVTDLFNAQQQRHLTAQLQERWSDPGVDAPPPEMTSVDVPIGDAFAVMRIPAFGSDFAAAVVRGTTDAALKKGPGQYVDTAAPGEVGNFAIAGHRFGTGAPFLNLDTLVPGDAIVFETDHYWYVYRVIGDPSTGDFTDASFPAPGREITTPDDYDQIAPVPGDPSAQPTQALLTLTTCHPWYSAAERLIIHAYLDGDPLPKVHYPGPDDIPALLDG